MLIQIDPLAFTNSYSFEQNNQDTAQVKAKVLTGKERDTLLKEEPKLSIQGDLFTYSGVSFERMSRKELEEEKIDYESLKLTKSFTTQDQNDHRVIVALRDPQDPSKMIAYKLDKEVLEDLKESFSKQDFFDRDDGIMRLSGRAEEYIAGWILDIKEKRGYEKADANGDGVISGNEQDDLKVGFEQKSEYSYVGKQIIDAQTQVKESYKKLSELKENKQSQALFYKQTLQFESSVEKELARTISLDKDKDGTITLEEGLGAYVTENEELNESFVAQVQRDHTAWINKMRLKLDEALLQKRELLLDTSQEEEKQS
jgi:hypothetical protein